MDSKGIKKSTIQQLKTLVEHMEQNPVLAKGAPVFGATKLSTEEEWKNVCQKLNSLGPPTRSLAEWKKTWADLKCRTKKKIGENNKSMRETGGGLYRFNYLTDLEQIIDRTLCLSSAAAPSGSVFGIGVENTATESVEESFQLLVKTPPKKKSAVAVITPNRAKEAEVRPSKNIDEELPQCSKMQPQQQTPDAGTEQKASKREQSLLNDREDPVFSSAKKRKTNFDAQLSLIRRQIRVSEQTAATSIDQVDAVKKLADAIERLADAAEVQAESSRRSADSAEATAASMRAIQQSTHQIEGVELFAKRRRISEKWVVDENNVGTLDPSDLPDYRHYQHQQKPSTSPSLLSAYTDAGKHRVQLNLHQERLLERYAEPGLKVVQTPWEAALNSGSASAAFVEEKLSPYQTMALTPSPIPQLFDASQDGVPLQAASKTHDSFSKPYSADDYQKYPAHTAHLQQVQHDQQQYTGNNSQRELAYKPSIPQGWKAPSMSLPKEM